MDAPFCSEEVDPTLPQEDLHAAIRRVCKGVIKEWTDIEDSNFNVSKITGGITNLLMKVWVDSKGLSLNVVTLRIFGPNTGAVIDRDRERQATYHLSASGFGPGLIGLFKNGMVQSFIVARTLTPPDLSDPKMVSLIAKELRRFHETNAPGLKEPQLWVDITKFLKEASSLSFEDEKKQKQYENISFTELTAEIEELKHISDLVKSPVIFSHNDLLSGNFMYDDDSGEMYFLDFEYSAYGYRGYDIANHFNEYAGFDCDFTLYPTKEAQYLFFRHYLYPEDPQKATDAELEALYTEASFFSLASHIYWGVWGIIQARYSSIDFDYLEYFFNRCKEYKIRKKERLSVVRIDEGSL